MQVKVSEWIGYDVKKIESREEMKEYEEWHDESK